MTAMRKTVKRLNAKLVSDSSQYDDVYFQLTVEEPFLAEDNRQRKVSGFCNLTGKPGAYRAVREGKDLFSCNVNAVGGLTVHNVYSAFDLEV